MSKYIEDFGSFLTDRRYWDCDCSKNYIHLKKTFGLHCPKCGLDEDESGDSRVNEIIKQLGVKYSKKVLTMLEECDKLAL